MNNLELSVVPKDELKECDNLHLKSNQYSVKIGDWELGKDVTKLEIDMTASKIPVVTITCLPAKVEIEKLQALLELNIEQKEANQQQLN
ncbi:hypothetical protein [Latilactobacillus sakei]|uniref:hypothetical protein n=1 Tax=Latilactobacillus sakei TaxID=1599 RepID=UPI000C6F14E8|nr:hypothetical protein [Latilactobacillus sakei]